MPATTRYASAAQMAMLCEAVELSTAATQRQVAELGYHAAPSCMLRSHQRQAALSRQTAINPLDIPSVTRYNRCVTAILKFKNSKRFPVTAIWPNAVQPVYARTSKTVGSRGSVLVGQGCVDCDGRVLVWIDMPAAVAQ